MSPAKIHCTFFLFFMTGALAAQSVPEKKLFANHIRKVEVYRIDSAGNRKLSRIVEVDPLNRQLTYREYHGPDSTIEVVRFNEMYLPISNETKSPTRYNLTTYTYPGGDTLNILYETKSETGRTHPDSLGNEKVDNHSFENSGRIKKVYKKHRIVYRSYDQNKHKKKIVTRIHRHTKTTVWKKEKVGRMRLKKRYKEIIGAHESFYQRSYKSPRNLGYRCHLRTVHSKWETNLQGLTFRLLIETNECGLSVERYVYEYFY